jgi:hypothetical protein
MSVSLLGKRSKVYLLGQDGLPTPCKEFTAAEEQSFSISQLDLWRRAGASEGVLDEYHTVANQFRQVPLGGDTGDTGEVAEATGGSGADAGTGGVGAGGVGAAGAGVAGVVSVGGAGGAGSGAGPVGTVAVQVREQEGKTQTQTQSQSQSQTQTQTHTHTQPSRGALLRASTAAQKAFSELQMLVEVGRGFHTHNTHIQHR